MAAPEGLFVLEGRPTAQLIADQLREQIVQGTFRPGQQINESAVAGQLRTSRGPLREALQRLCQEGLLVSHRNRGVFVLELSTADIKEIYAVREAVELAATNTLLDAGQDRINDTCQVLKEIIRDMAKHVAVSDWQAIAIRLAGDCTPGHAIPHHLRRRHGK
jgi:DNA-binding GntR family transcriptional regulator